MAAAAFLLLAHDAGVSRAAMAVPALALAAAFLALPGGIVGERPEAYKTAGRFHQPDWTTEELVASRWTMTAKIDVWSDAIRDLETGRVSEQGSRYLMLTQDNDAHTNILGADERRSIDERVGRGQPIEPLDILYAMGRPPGRVLVIGPGGGKDVVIAGAYGAGAIDAIELNAATVDLLRVRFRDYAAWPSWDNVALTVAEGRHFVRTAGKTYDAIVMSGVDTFAALSSGAYALSENYLYTVEADAGLSGGASSPGAFSASIAGSFRSRARTCGSRTSTSRRQKSSGSRHPRAVGHGDRERQLGRDLDQEGPVHLQEVQAPWTGAEFEDEFALVYLPKVLPSEATGRPREPRLRAPASRAGGGPRGLRRPPGGGQTPRSGRASRRPTSTTSRRCATTGRSSSSTSRPRRPRRSDPVAGPRAALASSSPRSAATPPTTSCTSSWA